MTKKYCKHCWPKKRTSHLAYHLDYYIKKTLSFFSKASEHPSLDKKFINIDYWWLKLLEFLSLFKVVSFIKEPDESRLHNRSLLFLSEAKAMGLDIKTVEILGKYVNGFILNHKNKKYYYEGIPLAIFGEINFDIDDKYQVKKLLQKNNIPVAQGEMFTSPTSALSYGESLGFPLVVKPYNGSLSRHVTCPISSEKELLGAIRIAKKYSPGFIVEKYITGDMYRASIIGGSHVFVCQKEKANIVGDGRSTIQKLIEIKNSHVNRKNTEQRNATLHKIPINEAMMQNLKNQNLELDSILPENKKIFVQEKFVLAHGCDIINVSKIMHPENKELFLRISEILKSDLIGIDFICPDISKSYKEQETAILEANSLPYIDMHQYPTHGDPEPVTKMVWEVVFDKLDKQNI